MDANADLLLGLVGLAYLAAQLALPVLAAVIAYLLVRWICCSVLAACSPDGGHRWREQRHRHRMERTILRIALVCLFAGVLLSLLGYDGGEARIQLPYGLAIENAGIGVILIGVMCFIISLLLRLPDLSQDGAGPISPATGAVGLAGRSVPEATALSPLGLLAGMTYAKAGLVTLALLPFLNLFALPVGAFLALKAWQRRQLR